VLLRKVLQWMDNYKVISDSSVEVTSGGSYTGDIIIPYSVDYLERSIL
jgi:uncharacterized membrane protein (UPF0182 family)